MEMKAPEHCEKNPWHTNTQFPGDVFDLSFLPLKATVFDTLSLSQVHKFMQVVDDLFYVW